MKKITFLALLLMLTAGSFAQTNNYNVGDVVDDFTVTDIHGVEHNLYEYADAGKYIYLDFFYDTCGPCQTWQPTYSEFYDKYGCNEGDLIMLSINNGTDSDEEVILYEETFGGPFNHAPAVSADGGGGPVTSNFGVGAFPTFCMIGPDRTLLEKDIWPLTDVSTFEATFPNGLDPEVMECTILGITDVAAASFLIFPTVSNGQNISIVMNNQEATSVRIYDIIGKEVYANDINSNLIKFSLNVSSGTYFVKVNTERNSATKKIIIK
jgi:thiol-disulfide isomerase/thioredoxin